MLRVSSQPIFSNQYTIYAGFHQWGTPQLDGLFHGNSQSKIRMMTGGTTILGNLHMSNWYRCVNIPNHDLGFSTPHDFRKQSHLSTIRYCTSFVEGAMHKLFAPPMKVDQGRNNWWNRNFHSNSKHRAVFHGVPILFHSFSTVFLANSIGKRWKTHIHRWSWLTAWLTLLKFTMLFVPLSTSHHQSLSY